jgi:hypothetical protein
MKLGANITERLRVLHEQSGIPVLTLKIARTNPKIARPSAGRSRVAH